MSRCDKGLRDCFIASPTFYNPSASYPLGTSLYTREAKVRVAFVVMI